jgi:DNA gyrase/topoisomerase IV subunit A
MDQTLSLAMADDEPVRDLKPLFMAGGARLDSLLAMTSSFRLVMANGLNLPLSENMDWRDARPIGALALTRGERIEATCAVNELQPPRTLVVVTRRGWVRALSWSLVENLVIGGQPITAPIAGDTPVWIGPAGEGDVLLLTRNGAWTRFPLNNLDAGGGISITLDPDDDVTCAAIVGDDAAVYFVSADGAQLAVAASGLEAHKKPGAKPTPVARRFIALACYTAKKTDAVLLLSNNGDLIVETLRALPVAARPSEAQPLNVVNQRLIAATLLR